MLVSKGRLQPDICTLAFDTVSSFFFALAQSSQSMASSHEKPLGDDKPSDDDLKSCRTVADALSRATWLIAVVAMCEKFAYYGFVIVLRILYLHHSKARTDFLQRTTSNIEATTCCIQER